MKATLLLLSMTFVSMAAWAQTQSTVTPDAGGQTPPTLSAPEGAWTKAMTDGILDAVARKDHAALAQITLDYTKRTVMGMNACGHTIDDATLFDAVSSNASRELAMVVRWADPKSTTMHSAVFTGHQRCVAMDGVTVDGKSIIRVLPNSLGVSGQHAMVAFEAEYWNSPSESRPNVIPHRGIFIEYLFVAELDRTQASVGGKRELEEKERDFQWKDDPETIAVRPGIAFNPAFAQSAKAAANVTAPCPAVKTPSFLDKLKQRAERDLQKEAQKADAATAKATGGALDGGTASDAAKSVVDQANAANPCAPAKGKGK